MKLVFKAPGRARSVAVLAGAFNPPTAAHLALARAALDVTDEVLLAIPRSFPHKQFEGATLDQRISMLERLAAVNERLSAGVADGGLFVEIAREAREHYRSAEIYLLCGRDAAERIVTWDYGDPDFARKMLQEFKLLVAPRVGAYEPPRGFQDAIRNLAPGDYDRCSSTLVREQIKAGGEWRDLVPDVIAEMIERIYR
jgi:nicotinate (nicotinamide) nucleotide adenylyltransferase